MTTQLDAPFMPAQTLTDPTPTVGPDRGEGVRAMALFEPRRDRVARAWDELSEIDRIVLLESVRQRRKAEQEKQRIHAEIYHLRMNR